MTTDSDGQGVPNYNLGRRPSMGEIVPRIMCWGEQASRWVKLNTKVHVNSIMSGQPVPHYAVMLSISWRSLNYVRVNRPGVLQQMVYSKTCGRQSRRAAERNVALEQKAIKARIQERIRGWYVHM